MSGAELILHSVLSETKCIRANKLIQELKTLNPTHEDYVDNLMLLMNEFRINMDFFGRSVVVETMESDTRFYYAQPDRLQRINGHNFYQPVIYVFIKRVDTIPKLTVVKYDGQLFPESLEGGY